MFRVPANRCHPIHGLLLSIHMNGIYSIWMGASSMRVCRQFALPYGLNIYSIGMGILDVCVLMDGIYSRWMGILDVTVPMDGIYSIWMGILVVCVPIDGVYSMRMGASLSLTHTYIPQTHV